MKFTKTERYLFALLFGLMLLSSGCVATPDSSVVRQKGSQSQDNYREANPDEADVDEINADEVNAGIEAESADEAENSQEKENRNQGNTESGDSENVLGMLIDRSLGY